MGLGSARQRFVAALTAAATGWACSGDARAPDVVLVTLDTVRADHVSGEGYALPTTPNLDDLAAGADRYSHAVATAPWTVPSHASIFTGLLPSHHGAHAGRAPDGTFYDAARLPDERVTLAEVLRDAGYRTAGFVANDAYLSPRLGFSQGFSNYRVVRGPGTKVNRAVFAWLDAQRRDGPPLFLFVNYMDAHRPYNVAPLEDPGRPALPPPAPVDPSRLLDQLYAAILGNSGPIPQDLVDAAVSQYDTGIAHADAALGALLARLERDGRLDDALVIVTADHGEYFGEHHLIEHSKDVYEPALRVPLVVKHPRQTRRRLIEERISLAAIPSLVVSSLPEALRTPSARGFARGPAAEVAAELFYSRRREMWGPWGRRFNRVRSALYDGSYKLILSSDGSLELYDLEADPGERDDRSAREPGRARALESRLRALVGTNPEPPEFVPPQKRQRLRELGYL